MTLLRLLVLCAILIGGCSAAPSVSPPISVPNPSGLPVADITFTVQPPPGTPGDADVSLVLLDDATGLPFNPTPISMRRLLDGRWQVQISPPVGSLLRYRYVRGAPTPSEEVTGSGAPLLYRVALVPGPTEVTDLIAAWSDGAYSGGTGRVVGRLLDAFTDAPLPELAVNVAGQITFTDGEGSFQIEGLPAGLHTLTAFSPDGSYQTFSQGVVIAPESATPAEIRMYPAVRVRVTFQVTLPADTPPTASLRVAGNLRPMGNLFADLGGGMTNSVSAMPTLTMVDATHAILILDLFAGSDLRYKYTLGDGLWNAERDAEGRLVTRQLIVPAQELVLQDQVVAWHGPDEAPVTFHAGVPSDTPPEDEIWLQLHPASWLPPLPMDRVSETAWSLTLFGPLEPGGTLGYRYCRNAQCGSADDLSTSGVDPSGRALSIASSPQELADEVSAWLWWGAPASPTTVVAPDIVARPEFEAGIELLPAYEPSARPWVARALARLAESGANAVTFSPTWPLGHNTPLPEARFDPAHTPSRADLAAWIGEAHRLGLRANLRPTLQPERTDLASWWQSAVRDGAFWAVWYESYRSIALTYARLAAETGADKLILGGPEAAPALPGGMLPDGPPSGAPVDAEARWRTLIAEVRSRFTGRIAFEIDAAQAASPPAFLDAVDEVHLYWHAPLGAGEDLSTAEMQAAAAALLDALVAQDGPLAGHPVLLSVEYLSTDGAADACAPAAGGGCLPASAFDRGQVPESGFEVDLTEQAQAVNAVLAEAYVRAAVSGFFIRRYNPAAALQDMSASVHGKPAWDVLWYWFPRLTGGTAR